MCFNCPDYPNALIALIVLIASNFQIAMFALIDLIALICNFLLVYFST